MLFYGRIHRWMSVSFIVSGILNVTYATQSVLVVWHHASYSLTNTFLRGIRFGTFCGRPYILPNDGELLYVFLTFFCLAIGLLPLLVAGQLGKNLGLLLSTLTFVCPLLAGWHCMNAEVCLRALFICHDVSPFPTL